MLKIHVLDSLLREGICLIILDLKLSPFQKVLLSDYFMHRRSTYPMPS